MHSILREIHNTICETEFEKELVSMKVERDDKGDLVIITETRDHDNQDTVKRRFMTPNYEVLVEVYNGREWIPEEFLEN